MNIKLNTELSPEITEDIKKAYLKMLAASAKYDVEYKTPYGRKAMRGTYQKLCNLCDNAGLETLKVCGELAMYDFDSEVF